MALAALHKSHGQFMSFTSARHVQTDIFLIDNEHNNSGLDELTIVLNHPGDILWDVLFSLTYTLNYRLAWQQPLMGTQLLSLQTQWELLIDWLSSFLPDGSIWPPGGRLID